MKNKIKKLSPITITILSLSVIGIIVSAILLANMNNKENPGIETLRPVGNLQDYDFPDFEPVWGKVAFPGEYNKEKDVLADYAYSDKYFTIDSTIYNPSLSTMSLCLELSVWSSRETDVWAEKTRNARKLLEEIGFEDFVQNDFWSDSPSTESIGVVAAHKELEDSTLIALPVRGGGYYNEWGSNVEVGTTGEHTGFAEGRDNVIKFLENYIVTYNITGRVKIWLVGYSRGGAVANLVAGYLNENELPNGATLAFEDLYCYAFEPPQGSVVELAGSDEEHYNIHNIVNPNDIVPMVAPVDWAFTRYNSTSRLLPTITTAEFESALAVMLEEYEEILADVEIPDPDAAVYNVSEYAKRIDVNVNPLNFLPGGDPVVDIQIVDDTSQTMNEVLTGFITAFADSLDGREKYNTSLEADLVFLLDQLMGYETGFEINEILASVMETMTANDRENLKYVLAPIFSLNWNSAKQRVDEVIARLREVLPQPEGFNDLYGTAATLIEAMGNLLVHHPDELLDIVLAFTNSKVFQSHYEEITLAWVRAGDPHYTDTPYTMAVPETLRTVRVNCPVNVEIYDSEGNLVASMIDKVATTNNAVVGCAVNEDGEIIIHLPADAEYKVVTTATGDGEVNVTLSEYNLVHSRVTRVQNYTDIPVELGDVLTLTAPNLIAEEYTDKEQQGSTAEYNLSDNSGKTISCQSETRGSEIEYFGVSVYTNNNFGVVNGGGQYLEGTFAMVEAQPVAGGEFIGWYMGSELVSTETAYRFAVDSDTILTAHFSEVPLYALTFGASGEGTVSNADYSYSAGSRVQLSAEAAEGYAFDHWETTAGTIEDASDAQTVFIVSNGDAAITAVFKISTINSYTVTYQLDGAQVGEVETYKYGETVTIREKAAKEGYTVTDWSRTEAFTMPAENVVITATGRINTYTITLNANGGALAGSDSVTADYNATVTLPVPTRTGYNFEGWWFTEDGSGKQFTAATAVKRNYTLSAHWTAVEVSPSPKPTPTPEPMSTPEPTPTPESTPTPEPTSEPIYNYTVTYKLDGEQVGEVETYEYGAAVTVRAKAVKEGYTVSEWSRTGNFTMPAQDIVITATSTVNKYTVTYKLDGAQMGTVETYKYGETVTVRAKAVKEGYTVSEWSRTGSFIMPAENVEITATSTVNNYTVTFDANDGALTGSDSVTADYNTTVTLPVPTRTGYNFGGWWFTEGENEIQFTETTAVTTNYTLSAYWTAKEAKIVFDANGESGAPTGIPAGITGVTDASISDVFPTGDPTRQGYTFAGWYPNEDGSGEKVTAYPDKFPAGTTTYYARWNYNAGAITVIGGVEGTDYRYSNTDKLLTILTGTELVFSGTGTEDAIAVADGVNANVTLSDLNIDLSADYSRPSPFAIPDGSGATITLKGSNTLKHTGEPALKKEGTTGLLTIKGSGSLTAEGVVGIGAWSGDVGNITIESGTITATANNGAGIGGGYLSNCSDITISGGNVTATGGQGGAGIGGGYNASGVATVAGSGTNITISGGVVTATGGEHGGAGIGGGNCGGWGTDISITGGFVTAIGRGQDGYAGGAGIGGGSGSENTSGKGANISVTGGIVKITVKAGASYIGGGDGQSGENLTLNGGIIFEGKSGKVYGEVTLSSDLEIAADETLHIPNGSKLIIPEGMTLTNNGAITYEADTQEAAITGNPVGTGTIAKNP